MTSCRGYLIGKIIDKAELKINFKPLGEKH